MRMLRRGNSKISCYLIKGPIVFFDLHFLHEYLEWDVKTECNEMKNHILHLTALGIVRSLPTASFRRVPA